jgi:hypothetical protein
MQAFDVAPFRNEFTGQLFNTEREYLQSMVDACAIPYDECDACQECTTRIAAMLPPQEGHSAMQTQTRTVTLAGKGYTHAAQEIDYRPYPVTVELMKSGDEFLALINGVTTYVAGIRARSANATGSRVTLSIDTYRYEAIVTVTAAAWKRAIATLTN